MFRDKIKQVENFVTNAAEIVALAEQQIDKFSIRAPGKLDNFETAYGSSNLKSLFYYNASKELQDAVWKTLPYDKYTRGEFVINRYDPGDFLLRHKDSQGCYWKFQLVFLQADENHFVWYDEDNNRNIVEEKPGMLLDMPLYVEHEVTTIGTNERPKYSLVLYWGM